MLLPNVSKIHQSGADKTNVITDFSFFSILVEKLESRKQKPLLKKVLQLLQCSERKTKNIKTIANKFTLLSHIPFSEGKKKSKSAEFTGTIQLCDALERHGKSI